MKKMISLFVLTMVSLAGVLPVAHAEVSDWAKPEIEEAISLGIVPADMQSAYQTNITRAEFAKISVLFVAYHFDMELEDAMHQYLETHIDQNGNKPVFQENSFLDIDDSPHAYYIKWANTLGITEGRGEGVFSPNDLITREEAAKILLRVYFCYGGGVKLGPKSEGVDAFLDKTEISAWADTPVRYMYQWDVMRGVSEELYAPKAPITKEQCYAALLRLDRVYSVQ